MTKMTSDEVVRFIEEGIAEMVKFEAEQTPQEKNMDTPVFAAHREGWLNAHKAILKAIQKERELTPKELEDQAFNNLDKVVLDYQAVHDSESQVRSWLLLTDKYNMEVGAPVVGSVKSADLTWTGERGMLEIALDREKNDILVRTIEDRLRRSDD